MTRKLFALTALLVLAILASWAPSADAVGPCNATYCATRPTSTPCGCPPGTGFPGKLSNCGAYTRACWGE